MSSLQSWLDEYKIELRERDLNSNTSDALQSAMDETLKELAMLEKQLSSIHDFLERGVYSNEQFAIRSKTITNRIDECKRAKEQLAREIDVENQRYIMRATFVPRIEQLLSIYHRLPSATIKNEMLKEVLEYTVYNKDKNGAFRGNFADDFELKLFPRLPKLDREK